MDEKHVVMTCHKFTARGIEWEQGNHIGPNDGWCEGAKEVDVVLPFPKVKVTFWLKKETSLM